MNEMLITPAGLALLTEQLELLKTTGREEAARRLRESFETDADAASNADYLVARDEQAALEGKIAELERRLEAARVAEADATNDIVDLGEIVRLRDLDTGARVSYELVGSFEVDPAAGRVSAESPLGRALIGRRKGDTALVDAPKGRLRFRILGIEPAPAPD
jgi:transcription elongation factor GreA